VKSNDTEVIVTGGFENECDVKSTNFDRNIDQLRANHEEADTRIVLHAVHSNFIDIVVAVRDTDVILLLIHHFSKMRNCSRLFVMHGTSKDWKFFPVHEVASKLRPEQVTNLMAFHVLTGCDSTSKFSSITKTSAWKIFRGENCSFLTGLGEVVLTNATQSNVEKFVTQLYNSLQFIFFHSFILKNGQALYYFFCRLILVWKKVMKPVILFLAL